MKVGARVIVTDAAEYGASNYRGMRGVVAQEEGMGLLVVKLDSGEVSAFWLKELRVLGYERNLPVWW